MITQSYNSMVICNIFDTAILRSKSQSLKWPILFSLLCIFAMLWSLWHIAMASGWATESLGSNPSTSGNL